MPERSDGAMTVHKPEPGQATLVPIRAGNLYLLDFDTSEALFERQNGDMRLSFSDGATLTLGGFVSAAASGDVLLELPDGIQVSARDIVESLSQALQDFHTDEAAAVSSEVPPSPVPLDPFEAMLEPSGHEVAPVCTAFCSLPAEPEQPEPLLLSPPEQFLAEPPFAYSREPGEAYLDYFITRHAEAPVLKAAIPMFVPVQDLVGGPAPAAASIFMPASYGVPPGDPLRMGDVLDTSVPVPLPVSQPRETGLAQESESAGSALDVPLPDLTLGMDAQSDWLFWACTGALPG